MRDWSNSLWKVARVGKKYGKLFEDSAGNSQKTVTIQR